MKIITWNVNGLRACIKKDFLLSLKKLNPDIMCIQETKLQKNQIPTEILDLKQYNSYFCDAIKKGYSGTAILTKIKPNDVKYGIKNSLIDDEGRNIIIEYDDFYLINAYVPNSQPELKRIEFRVEYENKIQKFLSKLDKKKPIIYCGDLNVAHNEIDLKNPDTNHNNPGFSDIERNKMTELLDCGFVDIYRDKYKNKIEYTWWSYRMNAREKNIGWRIDYFIISKILTKSVKNVIIHNEIFGSDHCPVELNINL